MYPCVVIEYLEKNRVIKNDLSNFILQVLRSELETALDSLILTLCPVKMRAQLPVRTSHSRMVRSDDPVAT